jgi:hypothetical protein
VARIIEERREVEVYVGQKGHVCIKQLNYNDEEMLVLLHPDDVPRLIEFLKESQAEAYVARASNGAN